MRWPRLARRSRPGAPRRWRVVEVHGEWTDDEWDRVFTAVADLAHSTAFPAGVDPYVSGTTLTEPPSWVTIAHPDESSG